MWASGALAGGASPRVAVVGAGGLGGPLSWALAASGASLRIFDPDVVELSNLHRQLQFTLADLGQPKAEVLAAAIGRRGGHVAAVTRRWTAEHAAEDCADVEVIVDGSDDPETKFAVADWAVATGRPAVIASALGLAGNVFLSAPGSACLRCLFEAPPPDAPTCAEAGVLGSVVATIAGLAALATIELALGQWHHGGMIWVLEDALRQPRPRRISVTRRPDCPSCAAAPPAPLAPPERISWRSC